MNQGMHRVLFNAARGLRVAVQETAHGHSRTAGNTKAPQARRAGGAALRVMTLAGALLQGPGALAQIVADPTAPGNQRPTVLAGPNGAPLVNIQTPSAAGVSRNTYSQFDVQQQGAVLNNARESNPWLAGGTANVILNEVNSSLPSQLRGPLTVGGDKAQVIVANPAGILVNGGSFVNASRVTLTTGTARFEHGELQGFDVRQGTVAVEGGGLNATGVSYTDILSRAARIAGRVDAGNDGEIAVTTGVQHVAYASRQATETGTANGESPVVAIDTAALGGLYAGKITLLATEAGVGVRNAGTLQAAGQLVVTADGRLENTGHIQGRVTSVATTRGDIDNQGTLLGRNVLIVSAGDDFKHAGPGLIQSRDTASAVVLTAGRDIDVVAGGRIASEGSETTETGSTRHGTIDIDAGRDIRLGVGSRVEAGGDVFLEADGQIGAADATMRSTAAGNTTLLAAHGIALEGSTVSGRRVHLETGAPFVDTVAAIRLRGGLVQGRQQTAAIASGDLFIDGLGSSNVGSTEGDVYLQSGGAMQIAARSRIAAERHLTAKAAQAMVLQATLGQPGGDDEKVTLDAKGDIVLAGASMIAQGSRIAADGSLAMTTHGMGDLSLQSMPHGPPSQGLPAAMRTQLRAAGDLSLSAIHGRIVATGFDVQAQNINIVGAQDIQLGVSAPSAEMEDQAERDLIRARGGVRIGSLEGNVSMWDVDLVAGMRLETPMGIRQPRRLAPSDAPLPAEQSARRSATDFKPHPDDIATSPDSPSRAPRLYDGNNRGGSPNLPLDAEGHIAIHAQKAVTLNHLTASAGGHFAVNSAEQGVTSTGDRLNANGVLSVSSHTDQKQTDSTYSGGASFFNSRTGGLFIANSILQAHGGMTDSAASRLNGQLSLGAAGTIVLDEGSRLRTVLDLTLFNGKGDVLILPNNMSRREALPDDASPAALVLTRGQFSSPRHLTVAAPEGSIVLKGTRDTSGPRRDSSVFIMSGGNVTLSARNIHLMGSEIQAYDKIKLIATDGSVLIDALRVQQGENIGWHPAILASGGRIGQGSEFDKPQSAQVMNEGEISVHAASDILVNAGQLRTFGQATLLSGRNIIVSGLHAREVRNEPNLHRSANIPLSSRLSGAKGVTVGAMGGHLLIDNTDIMAPSATQYTDDATGDIRLQAMAKIVLNASQHHEFVRETTRESKTNLIGKKTVTKTEHQRETLTTSPVTVYGRNIDVLAGDSLDTFATRMHATGNLRIEAGDQIAYHAVEDQSHTSSNRKKTSSLWGIKYKKSKTSNSRSTLQGRVTSLQSEADILSSSGDSQTLHGTHVSYGGTAVFRAGVGSKAKADARVILKGVKNTIRQSKTEESNYVVWQRQSGSGSTVETLTLPRFVGPTMPVFKGTVLADIPAGDFKSQMETLSEQPGMAYLQDLRKRTDVDWQAIQLAHDQWNYKQQGLTEAGAVLTALAVAIVTSGAGAALLGPAGTVTTMVNGVAVTGYTTAGVIANATVYSVVSQTTISLINNGGDIGKTFHDLGKSDTFKAVLTAAVTAGVLDKIGGLESLQDVKASNALGDKLVYNLINAGGRTATNAAITGGSLQDSVKQALVGGLVDTLHGEVASQIKGLESDYLAHKLSHAFAGCAAGAAAGGACRDGAIGAVVGEVVAEMFPKANGIAYSPEESKKVVAYSKLISGAVAVYAGGNAQTAIGTAEIAVQNNYLSNPQLVALQAELVQCKSDRCSEAQINTVLDKYVQLSAQNDAALAACTTTACVDIHRKNLAEAASLSGSVMWQAANESGNQRLVSELIGRQNQASSLQYMQGKVEHIETARKKLDQYVSLNCQGLTQSACSTKLEASQDFANTLTDIFVGFTPAGIAVDIKDLLQAQSISDYSLTVLGIVLPGIGDSIKGFLRSAKPIEGVLADVWKRDPMNRGNAIEAYLATTEYKDWFNVGQLNNGKFPLVDFQKDNILVSLKTVDTKGSNWARDLRQHIDDLDTRRGAVNDATATMVLDLRTQPGGMNSAQWLISYGTKRNVLVRIKEFK